MDQYLKKAFHEGESFYERERSFELDVFPPQGKFIGNLSVSANPKPIVAIDSVASKYAYKAIIASRE